MLNIIVLSLHNVKQIKTNAMTKKKLDLNKIKCREIYLPDLISLLKQRPYVYMSWGCSKIVIDQSPNPRLVRLTVNGNHHKGYVYIVLNGMDLFDVYLTTKQDMIKDKITGLYFDELAEWIDEKIEKIPEYQR
jgi:hypothetical protein